MGAERAKQPANELKAKRHNIPQPSDEETVAPFPAPNLSSMDIFNAHGIIGNAAVMRMLNRATNGGTLQRAVGSAPPPTTPTPTTPTPTPTPEFGNETVRFGSRR
jgi:hypothetical protein